MADAKAQLTQGQTILGIEFGSTRIKAVIIDSRNRPIASGAFDWENQLENGIWTYSLDAVREGLQACYQNLRKDVASKYGVQLSSFRAIGISGMMHGYIALDAEDRLLTPFRTWRNTITCQASDQLSELFSYPVPERWTISHLHQAILNREEHAAKVAHLYTLAGYVHHLLTGRNVIGIGDASGMFPIDEETRNYDGKMIAKYDELVAGYGFPWKIEDLLPQVLLAGQDAGRLTEAGARLIDPTGGLAAGIPLCPPEGDAGTGMAATNSLRKRTGNVSAGTSVFVMVVLEHKLHGVYNKLIDFVTTPDGSLVAMSHGNNCTGEYDNWIRLFGQAVKAMGFDSSKSQLYDTLLPLALQGDPDCGGLMAYNYISGETMTGIYEGRPLFVRLPDSNFTLANFMRTQLFTALGATRIGMDILFEKENVGLDSLTGHGGFFKTSKVGQTIMSAAMHTSITVMETAGEGGPWGMALLASYLVNGNDLSLPDFLDRKVFGDSRKSSIMASEDDIEGFNKFMEKYKANLCVEKKAADCFK